MEYENEKILQIILLFLRIVAKIQIKNCDFEKHFQKTFSKN